MTRRQEHMLYVIMVCSVLQTIFIVAIYIGLLVRWGS